MKHQESKVKAAQLFEKEKGYLEDRKNRGYVVDDAHEITYEESKV